MDFVTDLNHRERASILTDVNAVKEAVGKLETALEQADDKTLLIEYLIATFAWHSVRMKLDPVMKDAAEVAKGKSELDRFGGF